MPWGETEAVGGSLSPHTAVRRVWAAFNGSQSLASETSVSVCLFSGFAMSGGIDIFWAQQQCCQQLVEDGKQLDSLASVSSPRLRDKSCGSQLDQSRTEGNHQVWPWD